MLKLGAEELQCIRNAINDKLIFLVVDESTLSSTQFLNILVGTLDMPHSISYLYDYQPLPCLQNSSNIVQAIDNAVISLGTNRNFFCLLLSDAARYMMGVGTSGGYWVRRMRQLPWAPLFSGALLEKSTYSFISLQMFLRDHYEVGTKKWEIEDRFEVKTFFFWRSPRFWEKDSEIGDKFEIKIFF